MGENEIKVLIEQLRHPSELVRLQAEKALLMDAAAVPSLIAASVAFKKESYIAARQTAKTEIEFDRVALSETQLLILASETSQRIVAGIGNSALPCILDALKNEEHRRCAFAILGKMGQTAVSSLRKLLKGEDLNLRYLSLKALWWIGTAANVAIPEVIDLLDGENIEIRREAVSVLSRIANTNEVLKILIACLQESDVPLKRNALVGLRGFNEKGILALPEVIRELNNKLLYADAAITVTSMGSHAKTAIPSLIQAMRHENPNCHDKIFEALVSFGLDSVWPVAEALEDADKNVATGASVHLHSVGYLKTPPWNYGLLTTLIDKLHSPNIREQRLAAKAIGAIGKNAIDATPQLVELSKSGDPEIREVATEAFKKVNGWI